MRSERLLFKGSACCFCGGEAPTIHTCLCAGNCDFSNGLQVGPTNSGITVTVTLNATGTFHYACEIPGHCQGGNMNLEVDVAACAALPESSGPSRMCQSINVRGLCTACTLRCSES